MCQSKDNDVDVATDQMTAAVVERNKALVKIGKLERKLAKLEKGIRDAAEKAEKEETAKNTAANLVLMRPTERDLASVPAASPSTADRLPISRPASVASTPVTASVPISASGSVVKTVQPAPTVRAESPAIASVRQPLRSVNVFDKSQMPTSFSFASTATLPKTGTKRLREGEADEKLPAEAIMLPPAILPPGSARKPSVRAGFTPQRNAFVPLPGGGVKDAKENNRPAVPGARTNVFAESTPRRNPFAVD
jgi:hypothetical protein